MGKIISVVGNLGAGKTTLTRLLCEKGSFIPYWERPEERPFQAEFTKDLRKWALANQMDFFIFRCEQELTARQSQEISVMDGGLDQDFHVFTKNLFHKGHLNQGEYDICERFYQFARGFLPPPDLVIRIIIDTSTLLQRRAARERNTVDLLFNPREFTDLELLLDAWLDSEASSPVVRFPFRDDIHSYTNEIEQLVEKIRRLQ